MEWLWLSFTFGLTLGLLSSTFPAESNAAERWQCATTSHFTLYSTAERDSVLRTARELQRMAEILRLWGLGSRVAVRPRVIMLGFSDQRSFRPHQPVVNGKRSQLAGYVLHLPFGSWIGYCESDPRGRAVAYHEYAHTLVAEEFQRAPLCINEGLAEYLSTFTAKSDRVEFGHDLPWHRYIVQARPLFSMDELFEVGHGSSAYRGGEDMARFYAESWSLVQYLSRTGGAWQQLRRFVHATAAGTPPRVAFAAVYPQEDWDGLGNKLRRFMGEVPDSKQIGFGSALEQAHVDLREPSRGEVLAQIGLWRARAAGVDTAETARMLQEALSVAPGLPLARAARGAMMLRASRSEEAVEELRAASAPGTRDALALSVAGLTLMWVSIFRDSTGHDPLLREAGDILERSVAADSTDARALAGYVECRVRSGDVTPIVAERLGRVAPAVPDDPDIQRMRAEMAEGKTGAPASPDVERREPTARPALGDSLPRFGEYVYVEDLPEAIEKVAPAYPESARRSGLQGVVMVHALVANDGQVVDVRVTNSVPGLDDLAMRAVRQWRFLPARLKGQPVAVWVVVPVRFSLH